MSLHMSYPHETIYILRDFAFHEIQITEIRLWNAIARARAIVHDQIHDFDYQRFQIEYHDL